MIYFLDTNICIFHINDSSAKMSNKLESMPFDYIKIPSMVVAELLYGAEKSQRRIENLQRFRPAKYDALFQSFSALFGHGWIRRHPVTVQQCADNDCRRWSVSVRLFGFNEDSPVEQVADCEEVVFIVI